MNLIGELTSGLEAMRGRMDEAIKSIEGARTVQQSWDEGADALAKTATELAELVSESRGAMAQVETAVTALGKALDVLEGADTARLVTGIQQVQEAIAASEQKLDAVTNGISDLTEARSNADADTRSLIRETDAARGKADEAARAQLGARVSEGLATSNAQREESHRATRVFVRQTDASRGAADSAARAELAKTLSNRIAQSDAHRNEANGAIRDLIRDTDTARGAADEVARAQLGATVSEELATSNAQREESHRTTREFIGKTDSARGTADDAAREKIRSLVVWAVIPAWLGVLLAAVSLFGGCPG